MPAACCTQPDPQELWVDFLVKRECIDTFDFYKATYNYQKVKFSSKKARKKAAKSIYDRYLNPKDPMIYLPPTILSKIRKNIKRPCGSLFVDAMLEVSSILQTNLVDFFSLYPRLSKKMALSNGGAPSSMSWSTASTNSTRP